MIEAGQMALLVAMIVTAYVVLASFAGSWRRIPELTTSGRYGFYTVPILLMVSTTALIYAFVVRDFSVRYVAENSSLAMPRIYTWVAFYSGNSGSLLFLAVILSITSVIAVLTIRKRLPYTSPYATGIMALILLFFLGIMIFLANPLDRLAITPTDGQGINPLLIHFGMFIHGRRCRLTTWPAASATTSGGASTSPTSSRAAMRWWSGETGPTARPACRTASGTTRRGRLQRPSRRRFSASLNRCGSRRIPPRTRWCWS